MSLLIFSRSILLLFSLSFILFFFFFFNDTATTEIYTLSLHDALPIFALDHFPPQLGVGFGQLPRALLEDRKSTRLNSSHSQISYAVFCLKKKKKKKKKKNKKKKKKEKTSNKKIKKHKKKK